MKDKAKPSITRNSCFIGPSAHHDDVIKWKHFPRYWPFVREIHRSPVNFPHKGQWRGALIFTLICARINGWVNNHEAGDLRRNRAHCDVTVMPWCYMVHWSLRKLLGIHLFAGIVYTCFWTTWNFFMLKIVKTGRLRIQQFVHVGRKNQSSIILALWGESTSVQWIPLTKVQYAEMQKVIFLDVSLKKIQISSIYFLLPQKQGAVAKWLFQA